MVNASASVNISLYEPGPEGRGIQAVRSEFAKSSSGTIAPTANSSQWSAVPPTLDQVNRYMWQRSVVTYTDGESKTLSAVCIGSLGLDGAGSYMLDLSNEMASVGLVSRESGGTTALYPVSGHNTVSTRLMAVGGSVSAQAEITEWEVSDNQGHALFNHEGMSTGYLANLGISAAMVDADRKGFLVDLDPNRARVQGENIVLTVTATLDTPEGGSIQCAKAMTIVFQPPGADGLSPVVYELRPVEQTLKRTGQAMTARCKAVRISGNDQHVYQTISELGDDGLFIYATADGSALATSGGTDAGDFSISVPANASYVEWLLVKPGNPVVVLDSEGINVVADGEPGENGEDAWSIDCDTAAITFSEGVRTTVSVGVRIQQGSIYHTIRQSSSIYPYVRVTKSLRYANSDDDWQEEMSARLNNLMDSPRYTNANKRIELPLTYTGSGEVDGVDMMITARLYRSDSVYESKTLYIPVKSLADGRRGNAGPAPRILRWDKITFPFRFYSGADGEAYYDIAQLPVTVNGVDSVKLYRCRSSYTAGASASTPQNDTTHWEAAVDGWGFIATDLLMASNALVKNLCAEFIRCRVDGVDKFVVDYDGNVIANGGTFRNVSIVSGNESGARIAINPGGVGQGGSMTVYDESGNLAAEFSGRYIGNGAELYAWAGTMPTVVIPPLSRTIAIYEAGDVSRSVSSTPFALEQGCTFTIPSLNLFVSPSGISSYSEFTWQVDILHNSTIIWSKNSREFDNPMGDATFTSPEITRRGEASNVVEFRLTVHVYTCEGSESVSFGKEGGGSTIITTTKQMRMSHHFANGMAIGANSNNYFTTYSDASGNMVHEMRAGTHGLRISAAGIQKWNGTEWVPAGI